MADDKIKNKYRFIFMGATVSPTDVVVCIEDYSISRQKNEIDADSFCCSDSLPGDEDASVSINAIAITAPTSGKKSYKQILDWYDAGTTLFFDIKGQTPVAGDINESGQGYISSVNTTDSTDNPTKFSFNLKVKGSISSSIVV